MVSSDARSAHTLGREIMRKKYGKNTVKYAVLYHILTYFTIFFTVFFRDPTYLPTLDERIYLEWEPIIPHLAGEFPTPDGEFPTPLVSCVLFPTPARHKTQREARVPQRRARVPQH